jgi:hypothetical protein
MEMGSQYQIDFYAKDLDQFLGYQFTLEFDPQSLEIVELQPGLAKAEHFGMQFLDQGMMTSSWNWDGPASQDNLGETPVFSLIVQAKQTAEIRQSLRLSSRYTMAEAYDLEGERKQVQLEFRDSEMLTDQFELLQNVPNPFQAETRIGFYLPEATDGEVLIHDAAFRLLYKFSGPFVKGYNEVRVNRELIPATGVLFYSFKSDDYFATKRMLIID